MTIMKTKATKTDMNKLGWKCRKMQY